MPTPGTKPSRSGSVAPGRVVVLVLDVVVVGAAVVLLVGRVEVDELLELEELVDDVVGRMEVEVDEVVTAAAVVDVVAGAAVVDVVEGRVVELEVDVVVLDVEVVLDVVGIVLAVPSGGVVALATLEGPEDTPRLPSVRTR
jgi:hypothetical protein